MRMSSLLLAQWFAQPLCQPLPFDRAPPLCVLIPTCNMSLSVVSPHQCWCHPLCAVLPYQASSRRFEAYQPAANQWPPSTLRYVHVDSALPGGCIHPSLEWYISVRRSSYLYFSMLLTYAKIIKKLHICKYMRDYLHISDNIPISVWLRICPHE